MTTEFLLLLDLETAGLATTDQILEVGWALADTDLKLLRPITSEVVRWPRPTADAIITRMSPVVLKMHTTNGLMDQLRAGFGVTLPIVEGRILADLESLTDPGDTITLTGSGVSHFDHRMIDVQMPSLAWRLTHWDIDAGIMRRAYRMATGTDLVDANNQKTHRAADDVACHLAELRAFWDLYRRDAKQATMPIPGPETGLGAPQPPKPASLDPHTSDRPSAGPSWDRPEVVTVIDREGRLWVRFEEQDCWVDLLENYCSAAEIEEMYAPCTVHSIVADDDGARA